MLIINFFENDLNEAWFIHFLIYVSHSRIESIEKENNCLSEITKILYLVKINLTKRKE